MRGYTCLKVWTLLFSIMWEVLSASTLLVPKIHVLEMVIIIYGKGSQICIQVAQVFPFLKWLYLVCSFSVMPPKRKCDAKGPNFDLELMKLKVSSMVHMILELKDLLDIPEKFEGNNEDISKHFLESQQGRSEGLWSFILS